MKTTEKAYAKINLFLSVEGVRRDGYHDIRSVMHTIPLCDTLTLSTSEGESEITLTSSDPEMTADPEQNLVTRAARAFLNKTNIASKISIHLEKRIPVAAGLGGGSADAGATLRALNRLFDYPLAEEGLLLLGAEIGSDVPFCILGGTALAEGGGELLTPIKAVRSPRVLVAKGCERISAGLAYSALDEKCGLLETQREKSLPYYEALRAYLDGTSEQIPTLYNSFEQVILPLCPKAQEIKSTMLDCGASSALMSGSGPAVFGIFDSEDALRRASVALTELGISDVFAED